MAIKITRDVVEAYLNCKYKAHLTLAGQRGVISNYESWLSETRKRVSHIGTNTLVAQCKDGEVLRGVVLTSSVLKQGAPLILQAVIEDERLAIVFDALQKLPGPSELGDFHYIPVLFHETEKLGRPHRILLELLGLILGTIQRAQPRWGILMNGLNCAVNRVRLRLDQGHARHILQTLTESQATGTTPRLVLNRHCQQCQFRDHCQAQAITKDDLSLLRGLGEKEIAKYGKRGIFTVTQLSCTFRPRRQTKRSKDQKPSHHPALKAMAIREKKIYILGTPELPISATRIFFDVEGDPDRGFAYLLGLIVETGETEERHVLWANTLADEARIFQQFLDILNRYEDFRLYSYGRYEATFLRRMFRASGQA
jgi:predicted RecB family nuclease